MRSRISPAFGMLAIAFGCAALTFGFFDTYPAFAKGHRGPVLAELSGLAFSALLVSAPVIWIVALVQRNRAASALLEIHGALYSVLLVIILVVDSPGHSSPAEAFRGPIELGLVVVIVVELIVLSIAISATASRGERVGLPLGPALAAALLGGWIIGILIWSSMLPPRVIAAAQAVAGDRPYCIDVDGRAARSAGDLDALSMRATNLQGWTFNFHALLAIGAQPDRSYMNWSYRSGGFEPVSDSARRNLHLDAQTRCVPSPYFARDW